MYKGFVLKAWNVLWLGSMSGVVFNYGNYRKLGFLIYLSEEDGLNMTDCLQSSMTGRIGLKNMWMYTPHLANLLYFQDNYSNVLLLEWLKMTCQSRMDVRNCLKWLWLRWSWNHVSYVGPTWSWFTSHTRQDIAGQIWAMYLMRNPCRWPLSHILGSTQIDSFLGPETDRSCIYMYIYIFKCIFILVQYIYTCI